MARVRAPTHPRPNQSERLSVSAFVCSLANLTIVNLRSVVEGEGEEVERGGGATEEAEEGRKITEEEELKEKKR